VKLKKKKTSTAKHETRTLALANEKAMIGGILEGSPDGIAVAIIRLKCGCKKMAAIDKDGEPASKVVIYRDQANEICPKCKEDNGAFTRVKESIIHWEDPMPSIEKQQAIELKVLGNMPPAN